MNRRLAFQGAREGRKSSSHCRSPRERSNAALHAPASESFVPAPIATDPEEEPFAIIRINGSIVLVAVGSPG